uniref:Peptidase_M13_N domain-containing protein n=1 Tax=Schistocephalus solidus TaxID=70667 RepID=A0A183TFW6_SCHSO
LFILGVHDIKLSSCSPKKCPASSVGNRHLSPAYVGTPLADILTAFMEQKVFSILSFLLCQTVECVATSQKILSGMNFSEDPCSDFYSYACGNWIENHHIPPGTNSWTVFSELAQTAELFAKELLGNIVCENLSFIYPL